MTNALRTIGSHIQFFEIDADATKYRFAITDIEGVDDPDRSTIASGMDRALTYYYVTIHMGGISGAGLVRPFREALIGSMRGYVGYLIGPGHGFEHVDRYTMTAIVLAVTAYHKWLLDQLDGENPGEALLLGNMQFAMEGARHYV